MDQHLFYYYFILFISFFFLFLISKFLLQFPKNHKNLPPTPFSLPIIGHLHLIQDPLHRVLHALSLKYGHAFIIHFRSRPVLVLSSSSLVEECVTQINVLEYQPSGPYCSPLSRPMKHDYASMIAAHYGPYWRKLRHLTTIELFSITRLNMYSDVRLDETRSLIKSLMFGILHNNFTCVGLRPRLQDMSFNIIMRIVSGKINFGPEVDDLMVALNFRQMIMEIFKPRARYPKELLSFMQWIDIDGMKKTLLRLKATKDACSNDLLDEFWKKDGVSNKEMIDAMLSLQKSLHKNYSDHILKGIMLTLLLVGTDSSAATIEWAMSLILNHPHVLQKLRAEVEENIGQDHLIQETDLHKLKYLQNIVNETLRLFPATPLFVPHESSNECTIGGYNIQRGTMLFVNTWAIHRDPKVWDDATSFKPERFEGLCSKGYDYMPFGIGKKQGLGTGLANRVVGMALGSLIQCFDWERVRERLVDLNEAKGLTMIKNEPLEAMCKARECMFNVLSKVLDSS
ncbi:cytochrome P450 81Q32-like [Bidens hawaiensis]|uniref:cytochrome P450 81Q32-like n=1 Tax=Bidens hawaiensis TaxID=980011 RepID=UPI00404AFD64